MLPTVAYPDAESVLIDYLVPLLAQYDADVEIGVRGGDGRFVRVRRVGGVELSPNHDEPLFDVIVFDDSDLTRMRLAQQLWAWVRAANNDSTGDAVICYSSTTLGPRQMPDPADATKAVCMFTVSMIVRAA